MRQLFRSFAAILASVGVVLGLTASPALANTHLRPLPIAGAQLNLSVTQLGKPLDYTGLDDVTYAVDLTCMPSGGTHSHPASACLSLKEADGDFSQLPVQDWRMCAMIYKPVVFTATGTWKGKDVRWSEQFSNECSGHAETGGVFDF